MSPGPHPVPVPAGYRAGAWEVGEPLASGSFGSVYAGRHTATGEGAALKFLPTGTQTPRRLRHLRELADREVAVLSAARHPRLVRMREVLTLEDPDAPELDGATVLVLERAETSLAALVRDRPPAPLPGAPRILAQVCEGLAQLHGAGWVHGDLKPGNVLLMADGSVRLADFGLAAELEGTHAYAPLFGTTDYTAPELLLSQVSERGLQTRPTADVWAFGVLAHLLLTGAHPFPGGTPAARREAVLRYVRGDDGLRLSDGLPGAWRPVVTACLAPSHAARAAWDTAALLHRVADVADGADEAGSTDEAGVAEGAGVADAADARDTRERLPAGAGRSPRRPGLRPLRRLRPAIAATAAVAAVLAAGGVWLRSGSGPGAVGYGAGELATGAGIPVEFRRLIVDAARACPQPEVTAPLIAAVLKVESDFDADLHDPENDEYGIARWTPRVLYWWIPGEERPGPEIPPEPPLTPEMSIPALGRYLCYVSPLIEQDLNYDHQVAITVAHRSSWRRVNEWGGVPEHFRDHADEVARWLARYTPDG